MRAVLPIAVLLAACAGVHDAEVLDAGSPDAPAPPRTLTYVVSAIDAELDATATRAHGIDLDGRVGGDPALPCTGAMDFESIDTGEAGIDDQFGTIVAMEDMVLGAGGLDGVFSNAILAGDLLIVVELSDVNDLVEDASVTARVALARTQSGMAPTVSGGSLAADQRFVVDATRLLATGVPASIHGGRVSIGVPTLPLAVTLMSRMITLALHDARIEARVSADGLELGDLGGTLSVDELIAMCDGGWSCADAIQLFHPDLWPSTTSTPPGTYCNGISAGFGFAAVRASLAP